MGWRSWSRMWDPGKSGTAWNLSSGVTVSWRMTEVDIYADDPLGGNQLSLTSLTRDLWCQHCDVMVFYGASAVKDSSQVNRRLPERYTKDQTYEVVLVTMQKSWKSVESPFLIFAFRVKTVKHSVVIEAAAMIFRAKQMGYDATKTFEERLLRTVSQKWGWDRSVALRSGSRSVFVGTIYRLWRFHQPFIFLWKKRPVKRISQMLSLISFWSPFSCDCRGWSSITLFSNGLL